LRKLSGINATSRFRNLAELHIGQSGLGANQQIGSARLGSAAIGFCAVLTI